MVVQKPMQQLHTSALSTDARRPPTAVIAAAASRASVMAEIAGRSYSANSGGAMPGRCWAQEYLACTMEPCGRAMVPSGSHLCRDGCL